MTLKSRLSQLQAQAGARPGAAPPDDPSPAPLRERLAHLRPERVQGRPVMTFGRMSTEDLAHAVNGAFVAEGLIRIEEFVPLSGRIGKVALRALHAIPLLPGESQPMPGVYIDTETTGLAGGSGTLAFLVGVAIIGEQTIRLTQFLITSFAAERALLAEVEKLMPENHRLVSYNGKSYDLPLLTTRFRMQGLTPSFAQREHLDLLHPIRRLFGKRWADCRLQTVEKNLLGFHRIDDLPGAEAPEAWFAFLRAGYGEKLIKVVEHNRQDILSLAAAHASLAQAVNEPLRHRVDTYALARWLSEVDERQALALLQSEWDGLCDDGKRLLAQLLRRDENWGEALPIWEGLADKGCVESLERLAKYHEHVSKDLAAALHYSDRLPGSRADRHRQNRLRNKCINMMGFIPSYAEEPSGAINPAAG
jgi:hypothetical protein